MRIDKYLWCIRIYKTRSMAIAACNGGKIKLNGDNAKASKELKIGDTIDFKRGIVQHTIKVIAFLKNRVSAKEVGLYYEDLTPKTELLKLEDMKYIKLIQRDRGTGRPTKKDRRDLDKLSD